MGIFDCATWRPIPCNVGGQMASQRGAVMHQTASDGAASPYGWFANPAAEVSAHFWIAADGEIEQYVDTDRVAWHGVALNPNWIGIEFGGLPTDAVTEAQIDAGGHLLAEGHARHGWRLELSNHADTPGFGYHRMTGSSTSTACPSDLRLSARSAILAAATGLPAPPAPAPAPGPPPPTSPAAVAPPFPGRLLTYPPVTVGEDVRTWQAQMHARGWALAVDGQYGPGSQGVCRDFQAEKGLAVDGIVGPETWAAAWTAPVT